MSGTRISFYNIRVEVIRKLLGAEKRTPWGSVRSTADHLPKKIQTTSDKGEIKRGFRICSRNGVRRNTIYAYIQSSEKLGIQTWKHVSRCIIQNLILMNNFYR